MKKITKILSVILCVLTVLSSVSIMSFAEETGTAADEKTEYDFAYDDTVVVNDESEYTEPEDSSYAEEYRSNLNRNFSISLRYIVGILSFPVGVYADIRTEADSPELLYPVALPAAALLGSVVSVLGVLRLLVSPVVSLFGEFPNILGI